MQEAQEVSFLSTDVLHAPVAEWQIYIYIYPYPLTVYTLFKIGSTIGQEEEHVVRVCPHLLPAVSEG